jgi:hypothetical protein
MAFRLPRLSSAPPTHAQLQVWWQRVIEAIERQEAGQDQLIEYLGDLLADIILLNSLITEAEEAIEAANTATEQAIAQTALANSYVTGLIISAADAGSDVTITISGHDRVYPQADGSNVTVAVAGASLMGLAYSTQYWIYYDDPTRTGGAVTYQTATTSTTAAQTGNRHSVGAVTTPAALAAPSDGNVIRPPGYVEP